jgi:hypothetical protein
MRIVIFLDPVGVEKVELLAPVSEQQQAHKLFDSLRVAIEQLDEAVKGRAEVAENAHRQ